jgi:tetratricopeptide (TPR) repeat protein
MKRAISAVAVLMLTASLLGQGIDMDQLAAADEFRAGVVAFNNGEFANAVFSLNRSLSFKPEDVRTRFWLGRAFYYSGYEEEALVEWRWVLENGGESAFLRSRVERLEARRTLDPVGGAQDPGRYVTMEAMAGVRGENVDRKRTCSSAVLPWFARDLTARSTWSLSQLTRSYSWT